MVNEIRMTNKFNLDLRFLYQKPLERDYMIGGGPDLERIKWEQKYEEGKDSFRAFVKQCAIDDLVYVFILAFKDNYPNISRLALSICNNSIKRIENYREYDEFDRKDIVSMSTNLFLGPIEDELMPMERDVYETKLNMKFSSSFSIDAIESALEGLSFSKEIIEGKTLYTIQNSPIKTLEVTANEFSIHVNEDKVILYYKL
jgi:hypothetical protein